MIIQSDMKELTKLKQSSILKRVMHMSFKILMLILLGLLLCTGFVCAGTIPMVTEWNVPANTEIKLPIPENAVNSFTVDWGDGTALETFDGTANFPSHIYENTEAKVYTIQITGTVDSIGNLSYTLPSETNAYKDYYTFSRYMIALKSWGELDATRYGFSYCRGLAGEIPLPTQNTFKNVTDFSGLFYSCYYLSGSIPEELFANATNAISFQKTFYNCYRLTSIPGELFANTTKVTTFQDTFYYCYGLTSIPSDLFANTTEVTTFQSTFYNCYRLTSIPSDLFANTTEVTTFQATFSNCSGLTSIPNNLFANTTKVTSFYETFNRCRGLTGGIPEGLFSNTTEVLTFQRTFNQCSKLNGSIPATLFSNTKKVTSFRETFAECSEIKGPLSPTLFDGLTEVTQYYRTFYFCHNLEGQLSGELFKDSPKVTLFESVFDNCYKLTGTIPEDIFGYSTNVTSYAAAFSSCFRLTGSIPENLFPSTTSVGRFDWVFAGCSGLTGEIPSTLFNNKPNAYNFYQAFAGCTGLTDSIPENLFSMNVAASNFGSVFAGCTGLTGSIPQNLFASNTRASSFNSAFSGCTGLTGSIPENLFSMNVSANDFGSVFKNCTGLTDSIPSNLFATNTKATSFNSAFSGCTGLINSIPENLFSMNVSASNFGNVFENCTGLTSSIPANLFATNTKATSFKSSFSGCTGLTGSIPADLFANNASVTNFDSTFLNCSNLTSLEINTSLIGNEMFYGCNKLTDIMIGDNAQSIGIDAFEATDPYNISNPLLTQLVTINPFALNYDWLSDNRVDDGCIVNEPEDVTVNTREEVQFSVTTKEGEYKYQWYKVNSGDDILLTEEDTKIFKSNIQGQANATASNTITIKSTETKTLSFDYMVSSEKNNDKFTVTIEDLNGITTVIDGISGEVEWTEYKGIFTPNASGEIILTLTYEKNGCVDIGYDCGAIRNLKYSNLGKYSSNYQSDSIFTITTPYIPPEVYSTNYGGINNYTFHNFVIDTEEGETIFKSNNYNIDNSYATALIEINLEEEKILNFDYKVSTESYYDIFFIGLIDGNGSTVIVDEISGLTDWINFNNLIIPDSNGKASILVVYAKDYAYSSYEDVCRIKNLYVSTGSENIFKFENDDVYTITGTGWTAQSYTGVNTNTLTIPGGLVTSKLDGSQYYCKVSHSIGVHTSRVAKLNVLKPEDLEEYLITEWTIPVDVNGVGLGTTIKLPIPTETTNYYTVEWGDGVTETFDNTADFPIHTYMNTTPTVYTIAVKGQVNTFGYVGSTKPTAINNEKDYYTFTQYLTGLVQWGEIEAIRYGFSYCTNLNSVIPEPTENSMKNIINMSYLFNECSSLTGEISAELFAYTSNETDFTNTFNNCSNLTRLEINTSLIGNNMFYGCNNLTDITIGDNVQSIGTDAFEATDPYSSINLLSTKLYTSNEVANEYDWILDNRNLNDLECYTVVIKENPIIYDGTAKQPKLDVVYNEEILIENIDYTVTFENNINVGIATILITGIGDYTGQITESFTIEPRTIADGILNLPKTVYTGEERTPSPVLVVDGKVLVKSIDYVITYDKNIESGMGSATVKGINNYKDSLTQRFLIYLDSVSLIDITNLITAAEETNNISSGDDTVAPKVVIGIQKDTEGKWATDMAWSKLKEFTITAIDNETQIAKIKIQNVKEFIDVYAISERDTSVNPITNSRKYQFSGDVAGYVTLAVFLQDDVGNISTEYLRIYNLDNTLPEIIVPNMVNVSNITAQLKDSSSGIRYFAITEVTQTEDIITNDTQNIDVTTGSKINTWYRIKNSAETDLSATDAQDVTVTFTDLRTGKYKFWAKDLAGNINCEEFEINIPSLDLEVSHTKDREWYEQNSLVNITLTTNAKYYQLLDISEVGKDLIAKIWLTDKNGVKIEIPTNMSIQVNEKDITNTGVYVVNTLDETAFTKSHNIKLDMTKLNVANYLKTDEYKIHIEYSVGENLIPKRKIATYEIPLKIDKYKNHTILASIKSQDGLDEKALLNLKQGTTSSRTIQLDYTGDLVEPYVIIQLRKQDGINMEGVERYITIENTVTLSECKPLQSTQEILASFGSTLQSGNYELLFELYDKYNSRKATESLKFKIN